jgi:vacuolar-type H+-ATPase subunit H
MDRMVADAIGRARFSKSRSWNPLLQNSRAKIMNPQQAQDQVKHMREFIIHEANEKADELNAKAEQDYTVEKQRLVEDAKLQIKKEFERRMNNVELETKM